MTEASPPALPAPVRRGRALGWLALVAGIYLAALWYVDRDKQILSQLSTLAGPLCGCAALVLTSYVVRYQRWHSVLRRQGYRVLWHRGFAAYLAGFAFTASPGKAGELLRIRYFLRLGVPARVTLTTFVYERALDLLIITVLGAGAAALIPLFGIFAGIVLGLLLVLCALAFSPWLQARMAALMGYLPGTRLPRLARFLLDGAIALRPLLTPRLTLISALYGAAAWLLTALAFAWLTHSVGVTLPWHYAVAIYPLAMLIGALSFVPGGVGTTEAAIVLMLSAAGASVDVGLTVAVGIRLASLWLAVAVGMLAMTTLEARQIA